MAAYLLWQQKSSSRQVKSSRPLRKDASALSKGRRRGRDERHRLAFISLAVVIRTSAALSYFTLYNMKMRRNNISCAFWHHAALVSLVAGLVLLSSNSAAAFSFLPSRSSNGVLNGRQQRTSSNKKSYNTLLSMKASSPPPYPVRVTVMGGGNFGLALATVVAKKGVPTTLLVRSDDVATNINENHRHPTYMSDICLPRTVRATTDKKTALSDATYIIHAVPVQYTRAFLDSVKDAIPANVPILSASKGIETSSLGFMADILKECLGEDRSYAFLSGPSFAREICEGVATAVVIASEDIMLADDLAELMSGEDFAVFTSRDVIGVEVGGAVKNVIAIAAGMCEGLGLGTNAMSGLVTRGCGEMRRLGIYLGARPSTISGLSGEL